MKKNLLLICLMVFVFMFSLTAVWAQGQKTDVKKEEAVKIDAKEMVDYSKQVELFTKLVAYGEVKKDSLILLSAVRMLDEFPFEGIVKPGEKDKTGAYNREALLKQAKDYASGDKELIAMIDRFKDVPEETLVRGHHHGHHGHHGGHHHGHGGRGCWWVYVCGPFGCEWICR